MTKNILLGLGVLFLTACQSYPGVATMSACGNRVKNLTIHYGDSELRVTPAVIKVKRNDGMKFKLQTSPSKPTDPVVYADMLVTISGKATKDRWISASGTKNADGTLEVCVPPEQGRGKYEYLVRVDNVGVLDPRAEVEH